MNWEELEQKHKEEWEKFEELKTAAWLKIENDRKAMYAAFGDKEAKIPMSVHERVEQDRKEWREAWEDNGYKARYLLTLQKNERNAFKMQTKNRILEQLRTYRENNKTKSKDRERDD